MTDHTTPGIWLEVGKRYRMRNGSISGALRPCVGGISIPYSTGVNRKDAR